jgi:dynein heavy chain
MSTPDDFPAEADHECVEWVVDHITHGLHIDSSLVKPSHKKIINEFLIGQDKTSSLFCLLSSEPDDSVTLVINRGHPHQASRRTAPGVSRNVMYFVLNNQDKRRKDVDAEGSLVTLDNIGSLMTFGIVHNGAAMDAFLRAMQHVYAPTLLNNQSWPESVQKEFNNVTHKFMATLTENANRAKGATVFYVPIVSLADEQWKRVHEDKELVQTFVTAVIYWTKQIREVVNEKDVGAASESAGPLAEIEYWRARAIDLRNICDQFNRSDVKRIVDALAPAKDSKWSVEPFLNLKSDIEAGMDEALDNLRYLRTLEEPCQKLAAADPAEIPAMIKPLLKRVHMVFMWSRHYKKERFFRLLRMIANEIVARCRQKINLDAIFRGDVEASMVALDESITAGEAWIAQCKDMLAATQKRYRKKNMEQLDIDNSIYSEIEGFVAHRCNALLTICRGQQQFGFKAHPSTIPADEKEYKDVLPCFGGAKGPEIEAQLLEIQRAFQTKMDNLRKLNYDILDVKATAFSDDFRQFKADLENLSTMVVQVIMSAFDLVATVESGAELIEAFYFVSKKVKMLEIAVDRRTDSVVSLFQKDVNFVQKEAQKASPINPKSASWLHPPQAGAAYRALNLRLRIDASYRLLHRLRNGDTSKPRNEVFEQFQRQEKSLEDSVKKLYVKWREGIPNDLTSFLDENVIEPENLQTEHLEVKIYRVKFPVQLQLLFEEARFWSRLNEPIPTHLAELMASHEERLRVYRENIAVAVRAYNNIVTSLNATERNLFAQRIEFLDTPKVYGQGVEKQKWGSQGVVEYFVKECRLRAEQVQSMVDNFKYGVEFIGHLCRVISDTLTISIEKKRVYTVQDFEEQQARHQQQVRAKIQSVHRQMRNTLLGIFDSFRADYNNHESVRADWHNYIASVDAQLEEAVRAMLKKSLTELSRALGSSKDDDKNGGGQLFMLKVVLANSEVADAKPVPEPSPTILELQRKLTEITNNGAQMLTTIPRLEDALKDVISGESDADLEERKLMRVSYQPPQKDTQQTLYLTCTAGDHSILNEQIENTAKALGPKVKDNIDYQLSHYKIDISTMWQSTSHNMNRAKKFSNSEAFRARIEEYQKQDETVMALEMFKDVAFVRLDYGPMKQAVHEKCAEWQKEYLKLLHSNAKTELDGFYSTFERTIEELKVSNTASGAVSGIGLDELATKVRKLHDSQEEVNRGHFEFEPLLEKYDLLATNNWVVSESETARKQGILAAFDKYKTDLEDRKRDIDRVSENLKTIYEQRLRQFSHSCEQLKKDLLENGPYAASLTCNEAKQKIAGFEEKLRAREADAADVMKGVDMFKIEWRAQPEMKEVADELALLRKIWGMVEQWQLYSDDWKRRPFKTLDKDDMYDKVETCLKNVRVLKKELERREVWSELRLDIELFKKILPVVDNLLIPAIRPRHWADLKTALGQGFDQDSPDFCLNVLMGLSVEKHSDFIDNLATTAKQQQKIEEDLQKIDEMWSVAELIIESYHKEYFKIASVEDINNALTEHIQLLSGMKMSRFVDHFRPQVQSWERTLAIITDTLEALLSVQTKWMYLENIFIGGDETIKTTLAQDLKVFENVHGQWVAIMNRLRVERKVKTGAMRDGLLEQLNRMATDLDNIQKSLEKFLESRRRMFPRFYFLSNDDLLEILGHTKEPELVQPHLRKCFEGLFKLKLEPHKKDKLVATAMWAADGEEVPFTSHVVIENVPVETWLKKVEDKMRETVSRSLITTLNALQNGVYQAKKKIEPKALRNWLETSKGMCLITASSINWTAEVERVLAQYAEMGGGGRRKRSPVYKLYKKWKFLIKKYCTIVREKLTPLDRNKLVALITIEVHARDILNSLQAARVSDPQAFDWSKQLRFYRNENDACIVRQTSAVVKYDYEYLGNSGRLVVTSLTDRAYMTLTTALQLHRGGLPQGPAGTGKTETVKDLGKAIAKYVMVFNCSDGLDFKSLGRMFSGLAQTGGWSCFDEFNRIEVEVLSVVAQQIFSILSAVGEHKTKFQFEGVEIPLNLNCGIFVTMNPGYAGRSELPDNLKALLRPISMMTPDFTLICEITLLSQGFKQSSVLAQKVSILYELMEKQLSKQDHYDFSLRNIKAVLVQAGHLMRMAGGSATDSQEPQLCLKACRDMNLPKFVKEDEPLFLSMLGDLFPNVTLDDSGLVVLKEEASEDLKERGLQQSAFIANKVLHLWDTLNTRHGVMVVGRSGSGKTVTWQTLSGSLKRLKNSGAEGFEPVKMNLVNPKSVTMDELYGSYNLATREWKDGILSEIMRTICRDESKINKWFLFDGPVDTLWIESMNTVLDDNKMLTLNSGERINLTPEVKMLFEVEDLTQASPATVSRCGMVYFNVEELGWGPYLYTWLRSREQYEQAIHAPNPKATIAEITSFIDQYMAKLLDFRRRECVELFKTSEINAVRSFTRLLDAIANPDALPFTPVSSQFRPMSAGENYVNQIRMLCSFCALWAVGGTLVEESRRRFDAIMREIEPSIPSTDTAFEYYPDYKTLGWKPWEDHPSIQAPFHAPEDAPYYTLIVPTVDTVRYHSIVTQLVRSRVHTVLTGNTGTGKTLVAKEVLKDLDPSMFVPAQLNFSAQTTAKNVQDIIEGKMEHPSKKVCQPPGGRRMVCLVEDLNMPAKEKFGAQPPLELLRQWLDNGFWYDRATQSRRNVNEMQLLCCMTFGRPDITARLLSKLTVLNLTFPAETVISKIFTAILNLRFQRLEEEFFVANTDNLVKATMQVYNKVTSTLLPIPTKSHYLFNLRDLSKVFQGIYSACLEAMDSKDQLITLWMHEAFRTFSDRMNEPADKQWFKALIVDKLASTFQAKWGQLLKDNRSPIFVDFWDGDFDDMAKYKLVPSNAALKKKLEDAQENFNNEPGMRAMNLVFFDDAMDHLCRIHRIIRQPRGNALLVGLGGSGRSSLTRLAAYLAGYTVFTIEIHKKYDIDRFRDDLRTLYKVCGGPKKQQRVFYFSDNQIMDITFLEDLNNMLSVGEVPNLFPKDEVALIRDELAKEALEAGIRNTVDDIYNFFIDRARRNLHLVIAMSPAHKDFRVRLRQFPALVSCTSIDWFIDWPSDALREVGKRVLDEAEIIDDPSSMLVSDLFVFMHESTNEAAVRLKTALKRYTYVTPSSYLDLVRGYTTLYSDKKNELAEQRDKLKNGMFKLESTKEMVGKMGDALKIQEEELKVKTIEVDAQTAKIQQRRSECDIKKEQLEVDKAKIEGEKRVSEAIAAEAQGELDKAMPALIEATNALDALDKKELQELKTYAKPPELVRLVMQGVQTALGRPTEWDDAKKSLNENGFLDKLKAYDKNNMKDALINKLGKFTALPNFNVELVKGVSKAASGLCAWVIAIHSYALVYREVAPKMARLEQAQQKVARQEAALREKQREFEELLANVQQLERDLQSSLTEKERLQKEARQTKEKMERATIIVTGLEGERDLWTQQIDYYEQCLVNLLGDGVLACGVLSYTGAFPAEYREELIKKWIGFAKKTSLSLSRNFDFVDFLVRPTEVRDWENDGLPGDNFSRENGVMVTRGTRWPLMIDPQGQANKWIKKMERDNGLKVIDPKMSDYVKTIETAVSLGTPVLLQDILEDIDPAIDTVVSKAIIRKGSRASIKIGDRVLDYNDNFKLYITTKLANPHYTPEICTKVCLLNFAVKEQGLEEQLLKIVVEKEKPQLEEQNEELILKSAAAEKEKKRLEDDILDLLAKSDDTLLENVKLVDTLQTSKRTQIQIKEQLEQAVKTRAEIAAARDQYRECAKMASILFFVLADLGLIDSMYQFALDSYIVLFQLSIKRSSEKIRVDSIAERVKTLNEWHTGAVYSNTCRGLFEKHKLLFSFHMTIRILMGRGEINTEEYAFLIKGGQVLNKDEQTPNPDPSWITEKSWDNITCLNEIPAFRGVTEAFEKAPRDWGQWFLTERPEESIIPGEWNTKFGDNFMQRMILVRCVRPDRVIFMVQKFIEESLGSNFVEPPPFSLLETFDESRNILPLVFVLSPGVDPTTQLVALAEKKGQTLRTLALGQGQNELATKMIEDGTSKGGWVFLANCHLMVSWLQELEKIIENLPNMRPAENFRLWLSSTPTPHFPIGILQRAIKMTTEPPNGIKANMLRLYHSIPEDHFNANSGDRAGLYRPLLFALCYFHAVLLERRKFGTLGYNVVYDFTTSDFEVSDNIIALYIKNMQDGRPEAVPFDTIRYLVAEASYGGRVTDDWDRRVINTYMDAFVNPNTLVDNYRLTSLPDYFVPPEAPPLQSYKEYCSRLPTNDPPEAFGQHPNADISSQIFNSELLLDNLMVVNATLVRGGGGGGEGKKALSIEDRCLAMIATLDEQIPQLIDYDTIYEQTSDERGSALNTCLLQEIQRYNVLLRKINRQKAELRRAVKGELIMNDELDIIFNALLINKVPLPWMSAYPSSKPLASWTRDLIERVDQMVQWGRAAPKVFWLAGFTYPTGFLKSLQQQQARKDNISIDQYGWEFFVLPSEEKTIMHSAKEGAYVRGLWLEGAGWSTEANALCEPRPMELIVPMPFIHFKPKRREGKVKVKGVYSCPMYMYPIRTGTRERPSFVLAVDIPTGTGEPEQWTKRGTALLLSTSE